MAERTAEPKLIVAARRSLVRLAVRPSSNLGADEVCTIFPVNVVPGEYEAGRLNRASPIDPERII